MKRVFIYCEGQTEESFINYILRPYFYAMDITVRPIICTTKKTNRKRYVGGVSDYYKIKEEATYLCRQYRKAHITTMFDYYAMPQNTPLISCEEENLYKRIEKIENAIDKDVGKPNFFFNFSVHEFEGMLFSNPDSFRLIADDKVVDAIQKIKDENISPEHINSSPYTAPSKRLERLISHYAKVRNGVILTKDMGIGVIMDNCVHFRNWIQKIIAV